MPANIDVRPTADLTHEQMDALVFAAHRLPDGWKVVVEQDMTIGRTRVGLRIVGATFVVVATFDREAEPEALTAFIDSVRLDKT